MYQNDECKSLFDLISLEKMSAVENNLLYHKEKF